MRTLASHRADLVFSKTAKGHDEVVQRRFGLNTRQRWALIVMDGAKTVSAIREMVPGDELDEVIQFLTEQGFIAAAKAPAPKEPFVRSQRTGTRESVQNERAAPHGASAHAQTRTEFRPGVQSASPQDMMEIRQIKDFMTTTATTYLGLMSANVIHRIERADSAAQLMSEVGPWHMALRESKHGNRFAGPYLDQVTAALTGKGAQFETNPP